jgi:hypothetical protein
MEKKKKSRKCKEKEVCIQRSHTFRVGTRIERGKEGLKFKVNLLLKVFVLFN